MNDEGIAKGLMLSTSCWLEWRADDDFAAILTYLNYSDDFWPGRYEVYTAINCVKATEIIEFLRMAIESKEGHPCNQPDMGGGAIKNVHD